MTQEGFSPEEKLLKLIRGDKKQRDRQLPDKIESVREETEISASARAQKRSLSIPVKPAAPKTSLRILNLALVMVLVLIVLYLIFDIAQFGFGKRRFLKKDVRIFVPVSAQYADKAKLIQEESAPGFEDYSRVITERELFKPQRSEPQAEKIYSNQPLTYDGFKNLSLIGIIGGENPQAIVEDKENGKSYFLFKGQTINQMKVEDILEDRVIFDFNGQRFELTL
ncbi:MAG: hypothetical protein V1933_05565 [Candidatus Omnitrophota bacterium]